MRAKRLKLSCAVRQKAFEGGGMKGAVRGSSRSAKGKTSRASLWEMK